MPIKLFNSMTRKKEIFKPLDPSLVRMYNCGLTVYDYAHIGNLRSYLTADLLKRWLEYRGFKVKRVQNWTDVGHLAGDTDVLAEDKMALAAKREKKTVWDIADFYIKAAIEDFKRMNFIDPDFRPRATDHIPEVIEMVEQLIKRGYAYVVNGSVYFDISKFKNYGKLSHNTINQLIAGAGGRVKKNPDKKNQLDFALWIADPQHVMRWESPWSVGYPGWHIECSVMVKKYLGDTIDIHTGGEDNIFPHHECEIAQSEAANGKPLARYWVHTKHLLVNNEKMSKSKGNFYTLRDLIAKGYDAKEFRYLLLSSHYRDNLNFTFKALDAAKNTVNSLIDFIDKIQGMKSKAPWNEKLHAIVIKTKLTFEERMDDDLDTPQALAAMHELVRETNKAIEEGTASEKNLREVYETMMAFDKVLGILKHEKTEVPAEIKDLVEKREVARKMKDFKTA
ncbi:MAG: cysteine--tRNA ligase, partial [Candidatus Aenigmatarchaeota archaeon]